MTKRALCLSLENGVSAGDVILQSLIKPVCRPPRRAGGGHAASCCYFRLFFYRFISENGWYSMVGEAPTDDRLPYLSPWLCLCSCVNRSRLKLYVHVFGERFVKRSEKPIFRQRDCSSRAARARLLHDPKHSASSLVLFIDSRTSLHNCFCVKNCSKVIQVTALSAVVY